MSEVARPINTGMETQDDTLYRSRATKTGSSLGEKTTDQILSEAAAVAHNDPLRAMGVMSEDQVEGFEPGVPRELWGKGAAQGKIVRLTGEADPVYAKSGFAIGDKVYHKVRKMEAKVIDVRASGKVDIELDNGKLGTTAAENLVKL